MILEKAVKILARPVCDHCLGRQFAQLLHGYGNEERGRIIRAAVAMSADQGKDEKKETVRENLSIASLGMDMSNFYGIEFHNLEDEKKGRKKCTICNDLFLRLDTWAAKVEKAVKGIGFRTFLVGTKLSSELIDAEEDLWERVGIDYCEPIKAEINREMGKILEKRLRAKFSKSPDINIILDISSGKASIEINPLFVYGEYQKLARGIPQTKWPSGKYKTSVEQIIAKPFMLASRARAHKLHGLGREDIDARCLGWRPFVLELLEPRNRDINIKGTAKKITGKVRIRNARISDISEVRRIKESRADKTYRLVVECERELTRHDLARLSGLKGVRQNTPQRVLHRRADKARNRSVKEIHARLLGKRKFELTVRCEAGLYVKELVSGDSGRTKPSVSDILNAKCFCRELDVMKVHF